MPTALELQTRKLGLDERTCAASKEFRQWCEQNKDRCYIPEWLVEALRNDVTLINDQN